MLRNKKFSVLAGLAAFAAACVRKDDWERTADGGVLIHRGIKMSGVYVHSVNGQDERRDPNLIPDAAILHTLDVVLKNGTRYAAWYLAPFAGAVTPAANWTAANFTSTASEIVSGSEGYSEATRQQWVGGTPAANKVDNLASKANFTIVCTTSLNINGAGLLSANAKGATSGVLISASRFGATRPVNNGDVWQCGYEISLADS